MDPQIDPLTGLPIENDGGTPNVVQIKQEDWDKLNQRLDSFESGGNFGNQPVMQAPAGPSIDEQLAAIDTKIAGFDAQIDAAVEDGKPVSALMRERDKLSREYTRLEIKSKDIDPALGEGIGVIEQISSEMTRGKMPHYDLVKKDVEKQLAGLPPNQRMNPQVRKAAYDIAVGQNLDKILAKQREEILREGIDDPGTAGGGSGGKNGRNGGGGGAIPKPKDILGADAMNALRTKGITADQHYQTLGYAGWEDYWEKRGKAYFGDPNEEED